MMKLLPPTAISGSDLDRSFRFYKDILAMNPDWRNDHQRSEAPQKVVALKNANVSYAISSGWGGRIDSFQYHSPAGEPYPFDKAMCDKGPTQIACEVEGIDGQYEKLAVQGVLLNMAPLEVLPGVKATDFHDANRVPLKGV